MIKEGKVGRGRHPTALCVYLNGGRRENELR